MVASATKTMSPIGNPFQAMEGWAVDVEVDVSRHNTPYLALRFKINKGRKDRPVSDKQDQWVTFSVTWRPSMMADFKKSTLSGSVLMGLAEHALVAGRCPSGESDNLSKLVAIKFLSSSCDKPKFSPLERKLWKHLLEDVQHGLNCLLLGEGRNVTIWFCAEPLPQAPGDRWILPLQKAIQEC